MTLRILVGDEPLKDMGRCGGPCGRLLVAQRRWRALPVAVKSQAGTRYTQHRARGLCPGCYVAISATDDLADHERRTLSAEEFAEEYKILGPLGEGLTREAIGVRLNMTEDGVKAALKRARGKRLI